MHDVQKKGAHGGARAGAGRKRTEKRSYVPHDVLRSHALSHPMHITLRAVRGLPSFRVPYVLLLLLMQLRRLNDAAFQIVHFSVQTNHFHLIVEADDRETVTRKMSALMISLARRINRWAGRKGTVWRERYFCRDITTAREMHNVLTYVFGNASKHGVLPSGVIDPFSSAWTFDGFGFDVPPPPESLRWTPPKPRTALLETDWIAHGLVSIRAVEFRTRLRARR